MKRIFLPIQGLALLWLNVAMAQENHQHEVHFQEYEPVSIMGAHLHPKGGGMISYRYMPMWMEGNLSSSKDIPNNEIYQSYMAAPQKMRMNMHMIGAMYALSDNLTFMVMGNYISNYMDLRSGMGVDFTTESGGLGDVTVSGLAKILNKKGNSVHANIGLSVPTGNIDQRDDTPMMADAQLAYPMQLGSGTFDPFIGATYLGHSHRFSWGGQSIFRLSTRENTENYALGSKFNAVGWGVVIVSDYLSFSGSASWLYIGSIEGADTDMDPMVMPLFNTANSGRKQIDLGIGANFYIPEGTLKNIRIAAEVKFPVLQKVEGIQMDNKLMATFGIQYIFGHKE